MSIHCAGASGKTGAAESSSCSSIAEALGSKALLGEEEGEGRISGFFFRVLRRCFFLGDSNTAELSELSSSIIVLDLVDRVEVVTFGFRLRDAAAFAFARVFRVRTVVSGSASA